MILRMNALLTIFILVFVSMGGGTLSKSCGDAEVYDETLGRCCSTCGAGQGVTSRCTAEKDTVCESCRPGESYRLNGTGRRHLESCIACSKCQRDALVKISCSPTSNTVCECSHGHFLNESTGQCQACTRCGQGEGVTEACSGSRDTVCSPCQDGVTYSQISSHTAQCSTCRVCESWETVESNCSTEQNTKCKNIQPRLGIQSPSFFNWNRPSSKSLNSDNATNPETPGRPQVTTTTPSDGSMIYVYCSLMSLIVVALILYVFIHQYRSRRRRKSNNNSEDLGERGLLDCCWTPETIPERKTDVATCQRLLNSHSWQTTKNPFPPEYAWAASSYFGRVPTQVQASFGTGLLAPSAGHTAVPRAFPTPTGSSSGSASGSVTSSLHQIRYSDLSAESRGQFEKFLGARQDSNWRQLGKNLGFKEHELETIQERINTRLSDKPRPYSTAVSFQKAHGRLSHQLLLEEWGRETDATGSSLGVLARTLRISGQQDAVYFLKEIAGINSSQSRPNPLILARWTPRDNFISSEII